MHPDIAARYALAEARRLRLTEGTRNMGPEQKRARKDGSLSPLETLGHCAMVEAISANLAEKYADSRPSSPNFLFGRVCRRLRSGKKIPAPGSFVPPPDAGDGGVKWENVRARLRAKLDEATPGRAMMRHPIFGHLGPENLVELIDAHAEYHELRAF